MFNLNVLLSYQNVLVVIAVWFIIETMKRFAPAYWKGPMGSKLLVLMPMFWCQVAVWTTMSFQPATTPGQRTVLGFVLAFLTAHAHDVFKKLGLQSLLPKKKEAPDVVEVPPSV